MAALQTHNKRPYRPGPYKLVVLGAGGVGKSALTIRFISNEFMEDYDPTVEDIYRKDVLVDDKVYLVDVLDTAGQEEFAAMRDGWWCSDGQGFLLVYSIDTKRTFDHVQLLYQKILRAKDATEVPIVLAGNKCDLVEGRQVTHAEGQRLADKWGIPFMETSALKAVNNQACFVEIVRQIRRQEDEKAKKPLAPQAVRSKRCKIL